MPSAPAVARAREISRANEWVVSASTTATANDIIWKVWTTTSSTTSSVTYDPWPIWVLQNNDTRTGIITATNSTVVTASSSTAANIRIWSEWNQNYRISNEEYQRRLAQNQAQQAQYEQRRIQAEGEKQAARERAAKLLQEHLTAEQRAELADKGYFSLRTIDKTGRTRHYQIRKGFHRNVHEVDPSSGRRLNIICAHPRVSVPDEDSMLIQKLMLESPEGHDEFLKIANVSPYHA